MLPTLLGPCAPHSLKNLYFLLDLLDEANTAQDNGVKDHDNTYRQFSADFVRENSHELAGEIELMKRTIYNLTAQLSDMVDIVRTKGHPHHPCLRDDAELALFQGRACA